MKPILFRVGPLVGYSYTLALLVGMVAGTWMAIRTARERFSAPAFVLDAGFWCLLAGVLGGRVGYVVANWAYYVDHWSRAVALQDGGLSWHGALLGGGMAFGVWYLARRRVDALLPEWQILLDAIAPGLALGGAWGWLGCLLTGCAYGAEASGYAPPLSWLTAHLPDIYGVSEARFVTQPLMVGWCVLLWLVLWRLCQGLPRGFTFGLYLLLYALADLVIWFLRGDGTWRMGLWLGQWLALAELGVSIVFVGRSICAPSH